MNQRAPKADPRKARGPKDRPGQRTTPRGKPGAQASDDKPRMLNKPRHKRHVEEPPREAKPRPEAPRDAKAPQDEGPRDAKAPRDAKGSRADAPRDAKAPHDAKRPRTDGPRHDKPRADAPRDPKAPHGEKPRDAKGPRHDKPRADAPRDAKAPRGEKPRDAKARPGPAPASKKPAPKHKQQQKPAPTIEARRPKPVRPAAPEGPLRSGSVALIGRANVGKSTLLNAALGTPLAITSPTPQTTRDNLLGVLHRGGSELRILDTPGLHKPKSELGRVMNHHAREAARAADVVVFVTDLPPPGRLKPGTVLAPHPGDLTLLQSFKEALAEGDPKPIVLAINKVDLAKDKTILLPLLEAFSKVLPFTEIVPITATRAGNAERLLDVVAGLVPLGPWHYGADDLTDRPTRYFAAEYVREQILRATRLEVPHAAAVTIDRFVEAESGPVEIDVTIHVERPGQKKILVGTGGEMMKQIGSRARQRVKELLDRNVILKTWVRVTPSWRANAQRLAEMGYEKTKQDEDAGVLIFADLPELDEEDALHDVDGDDVDGDETPGEDSGGDHENADDQEPEE